GDRLAEHLAYWKQHLAGAPASLTLPWDRPRPVLPTVEGAQYFTTLSPDLTRALKALSRQEGVTLYMTLVAAFQILLHRYSGQDDIVIGTVTSGRTQAKTEALIGFFVNTLVLRTDLAGNMSFHELLGRVREVVLDAFAHQDVPFEYLIKELQPERTVGRNPLFQVLFT
ncbi:MAG: non-ribosomal peptide synthetase, partial [Chloroflexi bacterium]